MSEEYMRSLKILLNKRKDEIENGLIELEEKLFKCDIEAVPLIAKISEGILGISSFTGMEIRDTIRYMERLKKLTQKATECITLRHL